MLASMPGVDTWSIQVAGFSPSVRRGTPLIACRQQQTTHCRQSGHDEWYNTGRRSKQDVKSVMAGGPQECPADSVIESLHDYKVSLRYETRNMTCEAYYAWMCSMLVLLAACPSANLQLEERYECTDRTDSLISIAIVLQSCSDCCQMLTSK